MYKIYFKQAFKMLKQNKFFSIISILGVALAIMMVMAIIVTDEIKNISIAPENNRDRTLYITNETVKDTANGNYTQNIGSISYDVMKNYITLFKVPEYVSAQRSSSATIGKDGADETISATVKYTDPSFWKIFSLSFIEGEAFYDEDFLSGICNTVISENMAKQIFKGEKALGQTIKINQRDYRVVGVVQDVSPIFSNASSDIWAPYTSLQELDNTSYSIIIVVKNKKDFTAIREEAKKIERKFKEDKKTKTLNFMGIDTHKIYSMRVKGNNDYEKNQYAKIQIRKRWFILIIIMLVPAINLSGLNLSRIKRRTPEIGVRKAFGAKRHIILIQILWENLITSFIGGIIGLGLSIWIIFKLKDWLLRIPADGSIPFNTIVSIPTILAVFVSCIIINILSTVIPAYKASRMNIVNSITNNNQTV